MEMLYCDIMQIVVKVETGRRFSLWRTFVFTERKLLYLGPNWVILTIVKSQYSTVVLYCCKGHDSYYYYYQRRTRSTK